MGPDNDLATCAGIEEKPAARTTSPLRVAHCEEAAVSPAPLSSGVDGPAAGGMVWAATSRINVARSSIASDESWCRLAKESISESNIAPL